MSCTGNVVNQDHLQGNDWDDEINSYQFTKPIHMTTEMKKDTIHSPKLHQTRKNKSNLPPVAEDSASSNSPDASEKEKPKVRFVEIEKKPKIIYAKGMKRFFPFFKFLIKKYLRTAHIQRK